LRGKREPAGTVEQGVMKISDLRTKKLRRVRSPRGALVAALATAALLLLPASALAQQVGPTESQYDPRTSIVSEGPGGPGNPPTSDQSTGDLPFTGLDIGLLIAAAGVLGASGLVLRRLSASDRQ
jgi:hypothetical protein